MNINLSQNYSVVEAASALGVHRNTIYNWVNSGLLKFHVHRINGRKFFTGRELIKVYNS